MVLEAARMAADKVSLDRILGRLETMRENMSVFFVLDNLSFAQMSGRVGAVAAALSSLLKIKPVLYVQDGMVEMAERVRTSRRALDSMVAMVKDRIGDQLANIVVIHAEAPEVAQALVERVQSEFRVGELFVEKLSLALAVHLGPGTVGLVACPAE